MSISTIQNFYKETITRAVTLTGATNIYVSALPTPDEGYVVISPSSSSLREIVYYTAKGTDSNGTYLTVTLANRGLGGTTAQTHAIGEPVRMNITAEHIKEISDALDQIVAAGAQDATATIKGISKGASETEIGIVQEATDAQVTAGTAIGSTGAKLFVTPAKLATKLSSISDVVDDGYSLSDTLVHSNDAAVDTYSEDFVKVKEIRIDKYINTVRVKYTIAKVSGTGNLTGQLYLNGVAIFADSGPITTPATITNDITFVLKPNDLLQVYARATGSATARITDFRLYGDLANDQVYKIGGVQLYQSIKLTTASTDIFTATNIL